MANIKLINKFGKMSGWNSLRTRILGRDLEGITELEYDDAQAKENVYGAGKLPIGQSEGNYEAKASLTLHVEERIAILDSLPPGARIQDIPAFDITVEYEFVGRVYKDVLKNCSFMNNGIASKQGDKTHAFKHDLLISHIEWNVR